MPNTYYTCSSVQQNILSHSLASLLPSNWKKKRKILQSTLVISKTNGPLWYTSRYIRNLDMSDLQNWGENKSSNHISQMNMQSDSSI